jgi:hypothetical protein
MSNRILDDAALPATKENARNIPVGGLAKNFSADADWNEQRGWLSDLKDLVFARVANWFKFSHNTSPPSPAASTAILSSNGGQLHISENGFPRVWIKSLDYVNAGDKRFGLNGLGTVDDAAALTAAINATVAASSSTKKGCLVLPSDVLIRIRSAVTIAPANGFAMVGTGSQSSVILADPTTPNDDGLCPDTNAYGRFEGFGIIAHPSNPVGTMLRFKASSGNSHQHRISDVVITLADGSRLAFQYGIAFDSAGQNSEVQYENVVIEGYSEAGIYLPFTQSKGHVMRNVQCNGRWDGVDHTANGGKFGVKATGGSFQFRDGGVGANRGAGFFVGAETEPIIISGVDMEENYQLYGSGDPSSGMVASASIQEVLIEGCRFDSEFIDPTGIIQVNNGCLNLRNNILRGFNAVALIAFAPSGFVRGNRIVDNQFLSPDSKAYDPVVIYGAVASLNIRQCIEVHGNTYAAMDFTPTPRDETLQRESTAGTYFGGSLDGLGLHQDMYAVDLTTFNAASPSQTIAMPQTQPKGFTYEEFRAHLREYAIVTGAFTLTMRVGTSSGGDELLQDIVVGDSGVGDDVKYYGDDPTERGSMMMMSGGHMPAGSATSQVFVTVTISSGNLGDGMTSNITRGLLDFPVKYSLQPRFLA